MTKKQLKREAMEMLKSGKVLEAGWIVNLLMRAPPETSANELFVARSAWFFGARYMLDTMLQAQELPNEAMELVIANLRTELGNFGAELEAAARDERDDPLH
jgi:hypothetical protein